MIALWLYLIAQWVAFVWVVNACILSLARSFDVDPDAAWLTGPRWFVSEFRPLYLPAAVLIVAAHSLTHQLGGWTLLVDTMRFVNWYMFRDEGDDRWKRRRAKAVARIKALASGRLVAVPT